MAEMILLSNILNRLVALGCRGGSGSGAARDGDLPGGVEGGTKGAWDCFCFVCCRALLLLFLPRAMDGPVAF